MIILTDNELFVKAFMEAEKRTYREYQNENEVEWEFSEKFENKMNQLLPAKATEIPHRRIKFSKRVIAAIIAAIILACSVTAYAARNDIVEFFERVRRKDIEITLSENSAPTPDKIEKEYVLADVPDEFTLTEHKADNISTLSVWENSRGEQIAFSQSILDINISLDNEHKMTFLEINGYKAYLIEDNFGAYLRWTDGEYWFTLSVPNSQKNQIMDMQKNIFEKN